jgi:hypothetical protein
MPIAQVSLLPPPNLQLPCPLSERNIDTGKFQPTEML